ncbi:DNA-directed DNA polymerase, partial [Caerostris darwini]
MQQTVIAHSDVARSLIGTRVSEEVKLPKSNGYIIAELLSPQLGLVSLFSIFFNLSIYQPSEELAAIQWQSGKDFVNQDTSAIIFIASFPRAWTRLKLYQEMDELGENVLYHDADSIIYASDGMNDPPLENFLGEFTVELEIDDLTTFASGGPKNYGHKTKN